MTRYHGWWLPVVDLAWRACNHRQGTSLPLDPATELPVIITWFTSDDIFRFEGCRRGIEKWEGKMQDDQKLYFPIDLTIYGILYIDCKALLC